MSWINEITSDALEGVKISNLRDRPNMGEAYGASGMSAKELKEYFDKATELLVGKIRELINATNPENYSGNIVINYNGINTLADLINSLESGEFANKVLVKIGENDPVSIASAIGSLKESLQTKAEKLDNDSGSPSVYGISGSNVPFLIKLLQNPITTGSIPVYLGNGNEYDIAESAVLFTGVPTKGKHAANKEYVDDGLASKAGKLNAANSVYAYDSNRNAKALAVSSDSPTAIVSYTKEEITDSSDFVNRIKQLNDLGHIFVATPEENDGSYTDYLRATNKSFVNGFLKSVEIDYDNTNGTITFVFKDGNSNEKLKKTIDLPIEKAFTKAEYDKDNDTIIFTTESGGTVTVPLGRVIGGIITPENLAQDLEGDAVDKAVSQAAVKAALGGKVDKTSLYEEWQSENVLDPSLAEEGYYASVDSPEFTPSEGWNDHFRLPKDKTISWGDNTSMYIRTRLTDTKKYSGVQICIIQIDASGLRVSHNVFAYTNIVNEVKGKEYKKADGATHFLLYTTSRSLGVSFADFCISFSPLDLFESFGSGTSIKESDIIITSYPEHSYSPVQRAYADTKVAMTNESWIVYGTTGGGVPQNYTVSASGANGGVARYLRSEQKTMTDNGKLNTPDPLYDFNCVNKRYLENKLFPLELGMVNALGKTYHMVERVDGEAITIDVPEGALPWFYVESMGVTTCYDREDNSIGEIQPQGMVDTSGGYYGVPSPNTYVNVPNLSGDLHLELNPIDGTEYAQVKGRKIIFLVEGAG